MYTESAARGTCPVSAESSHGSVYHMLVWGGGGGQKKLPETNRVLSPCSPITKRVSLKNATEDFHRDRLEDDGIHPDSHAPVHRLRQGICSECDYFDPRFAAEESIGF